MWIELSVSEQKIGRYLAKARYENARNKHIVDKKIGSQSNEMTDLNGIGAEMVFCKVMNVYPDLTIGDILPEEDAVLRNGCRIDVKSTVHPSGHLLVAPWKGGVDQYCLVIGEFPRYRIAGFMSKDELLQDWRLKDMGFGEGFVARQDELRQCV